MSSLEFESAERLPPRFSTTRELFVHSGNECAFPDCTRRLVNGKGQWLGEICHIEAALPGGERFNLEMTNEERRAASNLMLMCHDHHVETNDVSEFPVERMREIKKDHETAFTDAPAQLDDGALEAVVKEIVESDILDQTDRAILRLPQTFVAFGEVMKLDETPEELRQNIAIVVPALEALRRIPIDTRAIFAIVVDRGERYEDSLGIPAHELGAVTGLSPNEIQLHMATLERYGLASFDEEYDDYRNRAIMWVKTSSVDGWDFWSLFREFCEARGLECKKLINELRFDLLD